MVFFKKQIVGTSGGQVFTRLLLNFAKRICLKTIFLFYDGGFHDFSVTCNNPTPF